MPGVYIGRSTQSLVVRRSVSVEKFQCTFEGSLELSAKALDICLSVVRDWPLYSVSQNNWELLREVIL